MATRRETQERRARLREQLVEACNNGTQKSGSMLPPLRELAKQYGVSPALASEVVRSLADEGLLYTRHGAGTFVGRLSTRDDLFLMVIPDVMIVDPDYFEVRIGIRNGFESCLTRLGGTCLTLSRQQAAEYQLNGHLQGLVGVAEFCYLEEQPVWDGPQPLVAIRELKVPQASGDMVYLDHQDAGRQATEHLLGLGHRRIAYLGAHQTDSSYAGGLDWSRQRQEGWLTALQKANCDPANLAFNPPSMPENAAVAFHEVGKAAGNEMIRQLMTNVPAITAVVASNGHSTEGMFEALLTANVPEARWPAVVSFDDYMAPNNHLLSVLRPSWEELARQGATLLWERTKGRLDEAPQQRPLAMELIPRFSCRPKQSTIPHTASFVAERSSVAA